MEPLDVVFSDSILSLPSYVHKNKRGALAGKVIDLWQCVFNRAGVQAQYRLLPNRRSMQELLGGDADFHGARVAPEQGLKAFEDQLHYTDALVTVYEVLLVRAEDKALLDDDRWWGGKVGVIRGEAVNPRVEVMGGEVAIRAANRDQALKLLVGKRVDVVLYISARAGELITSYQGHELAGRTLSRLNGHGLLSAARHRQSPDLLARVNLGIASCKYLLVAPSR